MILSASPRSVGGAAVGVRASPRTASPRCAAVADSSPAVLRPPRSAKVLLGFSALTLGAEMKRTFAPPSLQSVPRAINFLNLYRRFRARRRRKGLSLSPFGRVSLRSTALRAPDSFRTRSHLSAQSKHAQPYGAQKTPSSANLPHEMQTKYISNHPFRIY